MIVLRARLKSPEEILRLGICCNAMNAQLTAWATMSRTVNIVAGKRKPQCVCTGCGAKFVGVPMADMKGWYLNPKYWEIEEGVAA